jgi:hypothetical protein
MAILACAVGCRQSPFRGKTVVDLPEKGSASADQRCKAACEAKCGGVCEEIGVLYRQCLASTPDPHPPGRTFGEVFQACLERSPEFARAHPFSYHLGVQADANAPPTTVVPCSIQCR